MGPDFLRVFKEFHRHGIINKSLKNITLIPKEGPGDLSHYRSIGLLGSVYKLLAKNLAERLKKVLPKIIGESQEAFVEDRQILVRILIANELVHMRRKEKKPGLIFKIDMEKAYDFVDWTFVSYLFSRMGFEREWCKWMKDCIKDTSYSILVNGSPTPPIQANRGLRQGDPLSPFIFTLVGEGLNKLVESAKEMGVVKGFKVAPEGPKVTHL